MTDTLVIIVGTLAILTGCLVVEVVAKVVHALNRRAAPSEGDET